MDESACLALPDVICVRFHHCGCVPLSASMRLGAWLLRANVLLRVRVELYDLLELVFVVYGASVSPLSVRRFLLASRVRLAEYALERAWQTCVERLLPEAEGNRDGPAVQTLSCLGG